MGLLGRFHPHRRGGEQAEQVAVDALFRQVEVKRVNLNTDAVAPAQPGGDGGCARAGPSVAAPLSPTRVCSGVVRKPAPAWVRAAAVQRAALK
jgi:hypothetical protein